MTLSKNEKIKQTLVETRRRRVTQRCLTYEFKIKTGKLTKTELYELKNYFVQCKWLYNYLLNLEKEELFKFDTKTRNIFSLDKDGNKVEKVLTIPAKIIQAVHIILKQNIKALSASKEKGNKIGKLKFKSEYNSIDLNQYGMTHELREKGFKVVGFKKILKVHGLDQLKNKNYEFANAKLIQRPSGYYIRLTCYENLTLTRINKPIKEVGLDYGIKTNITTSDNEQFHVYIEESERLKGLQKKLARQVKGSNNRYKTVKKIRYEYEKLSNQKKDKTNKIVSYLCTNYSTVYMQDEMIKGWHKGLFGKQVQHSCMGMIKAKLQLQKNVQVIDRSYPTTKMCYKCGTLHKEITLNDREFICPSCGFSEERDLKAAKTVLFIGQCKNTYVPAEHRNTDVERMSDFLVSYEAKKHSSMKHRSPSL